MFSLWDQCVLRNGNIWLTVLSVSCGSLTSEQLCLSRGLCTPWPHIPVWGAMKKTGKEHIVKEFLELHTPRGLCRHTSGVPLVSALLPFACTKSSKLDTCKDLRCHVQRGENSSGISAATWPPLPGLTSCFWCPFCSCCRCLSSPLLGCRIHNFWN